jgi:hypothetical protein
MKKQLIALTAAITTVSALSFTPSAQAYPDMSDDEEYITLLEAASEVWSGIPDWGFRAQRSKWIARGREACQKADNGTSILAQFQEAKLKGDRKTMLAIDSAHKAYCWDRHGSTSLMKRMGNYLGSL